MTNSAKAATSLKKINLIKLKKTYPLLTPHNLCGYV